MVPAASEKKRNDWEDEKIRNALARIDVYAQDNGLPLTFQRYSYTENYPRRKICSCCLTGLIPGKAGIIVLADFGLRLDLDLTGTYALMRG